MADPVLIGLFVTSHAAGQIRTYTFDNVSIEGSVSADFVSEDIASVSGNSAGKEGGGVYNYDGTASIVNSTISGNSAGNNGGGVYQNNYVAYNGFGVGGAGIGVSDTPFIPVTSLRIS